MAQNETGILSIITWIVGIIVSLAVGFALIDGVIAVPMLGIVNVIAGWVVVVGAIISVIMAIFSK
ncbi:hypothetical protein HOA55_00160 [archaeon]|jgi:hypothetical protein|nr:hypothetical protein [archaeon]MBT3577883.1 hypothetical protein [archaeon]MBT6819753.1 hypothetical protein [archaeon]MBT6955961.1 hypothetical protein [archaeon]MBT7025536.1 hypothetical protein [archaeon]